MRQQRGWCALHGDGETAADEATGAHRQTFTLWYADDSYADFLPRRLCVITLRSGKKVAVQYQDTIDYLELFTIKTTA